jgi:EAL domain-containing protein (putative c-di-GMP-specific phosphodiesterase class I)
MDPAYLELEVTESAIMDNIRGAITEMEEIRAQGVKISIDDFGTGYSSLSYLRSLPVDAVKIDQSFVRDLTKESPDAISIVHAIITLAHKLGLKVVAEGVETEAQMQILTDLNCDVFQGYLLHRPLDANALGKIFEQSTLYRAGASLVTTLYIS